MAPAEEAGPLRVRAMTRQDLRRVYEWSISEGWNIGKYDHDVFFASDPDGFFIGELHGELHGELAGEPVGAISGVAYGDTFGFIGMYIVRPEYRGKGYGLRIFETAMARLGTRCVGLDGVIAQQNNYRRSGFELAYRNIRFQFTVPADIAGHEKGVVPAASVPFEMLSDFDARHFPARRERFLRNWIAEPEAAALVSMTADRISAFGMVRRFDRGWCIGPLFAGDELAAETMFTALCSHCVGEQVFLDVPEPNAAAIAIASRHRMSQVFETARMYRGAAPNLPIGCIFGVTSFELG